MPGKNRYPLVGWHSRRPDLVEAARAEAERRGITLAALLDEALEAFLRPAAEARPLGYSKERQTGNKRRDGGN